MKNVDFDVFQLRDIETRLTCFVFPKFFEEGFVQLNVERQIRLSGRESNEGNTSGPTAFVGVIVSTEPDDTRPPHRGSKAGNRLHHLQNDSGIFSAFSVFKAFQKLRHALFGGLGLIFCHE